MIVDSIGFWLVKIVPIAVGLFLLAQGVLALVSLVIAKRWPTVEGEIVASQVGEISLRGAGEIIHTCSGYVPQVKYRFPWGDQTLHGSRIVFGEKVIGAPYSSAKARVDAYRPGAKVKVFYHPKKPSLAALKHGRPAPSLVSTAFGLVLIGFGILVA